MPRWTTGSAGRGTVTSGGGRGERSCRLSVGLRRGQGPPKNSARMRASATGWSPWMLWPGPSTITTGSAGRRRRNSASSASSTTGESAPRASRTGTRDVLEVVPQGAEVDRVHMQAGGYRTAGPAGGATSTVPSVALDGVVEHPPAQRRLGPGRVELDGPLEDLVERGE